MDDKEKEKFGVIVDKNKQSEGEKPKDDDISTKNDDEQQKVVINEDTAPQDQPKVDNNVQNDQDTTSSDFTSTPSISETGEKIDETQAEAQKNENVEQNLDQEKKEHQVIHKKDGRLHIYVRQDKYKGELKSKNWVGRLYIDGKQKISSSGTQNLDEAIPILEKWFDDVHAEKEKQNLQQPTATEQVEKIETPSENTIAPTQEPTVQKTEEVKTTPEIIKPATETTAPISENVNSDDTENAKPKNIFEKLKNIKIKTPSFGKRWCKIKFQTWSRQSKRKI